MLPPDTPRLANLALHGQVFLFAAAVSLLTGVLSGLVPALQAGKRDLQGSLRTNAGNVFGAAHRFRRHTAVKQPIRVYQYSCLCSNSAYFIPHSNRRARSR